METLTWNFVLNVKENSLEISELEMHKRYMIIKQVGNVTIGHVKEI